MNYFCNSLKGKLYDKTFIIKHICYYRMYSYMCRRIFAVGKTER